MKTCFRLALLILCATLVSFAAAQGAKVWPVVKEDKTVKISPHVYVIPDELVSLVPNVGIIVGNRATLIVDPGLGLLSGQAIARETAKVSRNSELYIVNTHYHAEHTTGDAAFPGAKVIRAVAQQHDVDELGMKSVETFAARGPELAEILKGATFRKPDEMFEMEKTVDLGGVRVKLVRLGPAHTRGDTAIFVEGDNVLFAGDLAMKNLFPAFATPQSSLRTWLTSLDALDRLKATRVIGAHGEMADATVIGAYRGYLTTLQARAAELKREGRSPEEAGKLLTSELAARYPAWQQSVRIAPGVAVAYRELP